MLPNLSALTWQKNPKQANTSATPDAEPVILTKWKSAIKKINEDLRHMKQEEEIYAVNVSVVINGSRREAAGELMKIGFLVDELPMPQAVSDIKSLLVYKLLMSPVVQFYDDNTEKWRNIGWFAPHGDCSLGGIGCYIDGDGLLRFALPDRIDKMSLNDYYHTLNITTEFTGEDAYVEFTGADMTNNEGRRQNFAIESYIVREEWVRWKGELEALPTPRS